ncbi:hypothetical protein ACFVT1_36260 [Streptomyces sp. NPDC057963]|uniref:hypothetical protein n=1 Tax=Streptomyces sp. NPDC057963 TaxID=3346290 RepID=UPI0036E05723
MARKSFALRTESHVAEIGDDIELEFQPEVMGDEFLDAYEALQDTYTELGVDPSNAAGMTPAQLRTTTDAVRAFLAGLMLPESAAQFDTMRLPHRVIVALLEWTMEIYGGNGGQRPPTSSNGSAAASPPRGTRGTASSRSKGSTPARGR